MAKELSALEKRIRDSSVELKTVLTARKGDVEKLKESVRLASEAGVDPGPLARLLDAALESVEIMLRAVESPATPKPPKV